MEIEKYTDGMTLTLILKGRLDTTTSPQLEKILQEAIEGITELYMNFEGLAYISSAGLRVLLSAQKIMNRQGTMVIQNVNESVMEVLDITGFIDILTIE